MQLDSNSAQPTLTQTPFDTSFDARLPSVSYLDLSAIWTVRHGLEVRAGVNNVLDEDPPLDGICPVASRFVGSCQGGGGDRLPGIPGRLAPVATGNRGVAGPRLGAADELW